MLLDMCCDDSLLPSGEPTSDRAGATHTRIETRELVRQDGPESFAIGPIIFPGIFDQGLQPDRDVPQRRVFEEQSRGGAPGTKAVVDRKRRRIEIEICRTRKAARLLPIMEFMTGRHKDELPFVVSHLPPPQALDKCVSFSPLA